MRTLSARAIFCAGLPFALLCSSTSLLFSQSKAAPSSGPAALAPYGSVGTGEGSIPCQSPSHEGINICQPGVGNFSPEIPSPFQVIAAATSGRGQVQLMELWADGKKEAQAEELHSMSL